MDSTVTGIAASHDNVWVAVVNEGPTLRRGVRIASRGPNGHWSRLRRVPGTTASNDLITLASDPTSKRASAWEADTPLISHDGILTGDGVSLRHLTRNSIGPARTFSQQLRDYVDSIAVGWNGHVNVAHEIA